MFGSNKTKSTIIAGGTSISGSMKTTGTLHVDGEIEGQIEIDGDVSVGPDGKILGELTCNRLTVAGFVDGDIRVNGALCILNGGRVTNQVQYETLEVQKGGSLEGRSGRVDHDADNAANSGVHTLSAGEPANANQDRKKAAGIE